MRIPSSSSSGHFISISERHQWIGISTAQIQIFRWEGTSLINVIEIEEESFFNRFSKNGMFMIASYADSARVFINCNYEGITTGGSYFNHLTKLC